MRLLLDSCVSLMAKEELIANGHDVVWSGDWGEDPGDRRMLEIAFAEKRTLVTLDKDFGNLIFVHRQAHPGVLRLFGYRSDQEARVCNTVIERYSADLLGGALITVEPGRVRIRPRSIADTL